MVGSERKGNALRKSVKFKHDSATKEAPASSRRYHGIEPHARRRFRAIGELPDSLDINL